MSKIEKNTYKIAIKLTKTNVRNKAMKIKATKHKNETKMEKNYTYKIAMKHTKRDT